MEDRGKLPRLVLAEDDAPMAEQLRSLLAASAEIVAAVEDGPALVAAADTLEPDVIVTDISMPRLSGLAAAQIILARHPATRIVFVTVHDQRAVVRAALEPGGRAYVLECDAAHELVAAVRAVVAGEEYVSTNARAALGWGGIRRPPDHGPHS
jgi:DNA-binding NarL/FixJ family response regulator